MLLKAQRTATAVVLLMALVECAPPIDRYRPPEATDPNPQVGRSLAEAAKGTTQQKHVKRSFYAYASSGQPRFDTFTMWKAPVYQLDRPYFIPVYGAAGRVPIYYPPQPFLLNPGVPKDNPVVPFKGSPYLPPPEVDTKKNVTIMNKFNFEDEDAPVWGAPPPPPPPSPPSSVPTRAPVAGGSTRTPPLLHALGGNHLSASNDVPSPQRPTMGPSNCVWAIVSCCSTATVAVPDSCFEQRGCSGPFWGSSPCNSDFAKAAIENALNYYSTR